MGTECGSTLANSHFTGSARRRLGRKRCSIGLPATALAHTRCNARKDGAHETEVSDQEVQIRRQRVKGEDEEERSVPPLAHASTVTPTTHLEHISAHHQLPPSQRPTDWGQLRAHTHTPDTRRRQLVKMTRAEYSAMLCMFILHTTYSPTSNIHFYADSLTTLAG